MSNKYDFSFLTRKKTFNDESVENTKLSRVLRLLDVTAIGIGWTLGSGIYILLGTVVKDFSGPATIVSFLIAGLITFLSGLCYAELGSRVPRSGSAFVYIYVTIGEFFAFVMGMIYKKKWSKLTMDNIYMRYIYFFGLTKVGI